MTKQNEQKTDPAQQNTDFVALAKAFINKLRTNAGGEAASPGIRAKRDALDDELEELLGGDEQPKVTTAIRPDLALSAILLARAIYPKLTVLKDLKFGSPVISIHARDVDLVGPLAQVMRICALPTSDGRRVGAATLKRGMMSSIAHGDAIIFECDGSERRHSPSHGNSEVRQAIWEGKAVLGISADPKTHLPRDLLRAADYDFTLPEIEPMDVSLVIETCTGETPDDMIDSSAARRLSCADIMLAVGPERNPNECVVRLRQMLASRQESALPGPFLEELPGYDNAMQWALSMIDDARSLQAGQITWQQFDHKGLLLSGPPGVGKTSFVRALAKSAGIPIIATSVSEWVGTGDHLGHTLQAMSRVFQQASQSSPAILLIDELDGIGSRDNLDARYRDYWTQIVNSLLEFLEGFEQRREIIVVGTTNHSQHIDPAILRAGRLDREIEIELPTISSLRDIFRFYLKDDLDLDEVTRLAVAAAGKTGADVNAFVTRARSECRRNGKELTVQSVLDQISQGPRPVDERRMRTFCVHEAGHAVACLQIEGESIDHVRVHAAGGLVHRARALDYLHDEQHGQQYLTMLLAGAAAEELILKRIGFGSTGFDASDLAVATELATKLELSWTAQGEVPLYFSGPIQTVLNGSSSLQTKVRDRLNAAASCARSLVRSKAAEIELIAEALFKRHYLTGDDITHLLKGEEPDFHRGAA